MVVNVVTEPAAAVVTVVVWTVVVVVAPPPVVLETVAELTVDDSLAAVGVELEDAILVVVAAVWVALAAAPDQES